MKFYLTVTLLCSVLSLSAQKGTADFSFDTTVSKVPHSLYNNIELLDLREDTSTIGVVLKGGFNRPQRLITKVPLELQLQRLLKQSAGETAGNGKLLLVLKNFSLIESSAGGTDKGYCFVQAFLYAQDNGAFLPLASIDSETIINYTDVTKDLLSAGRSILSVFIRSHLNDAPAAGEKFTLANLRNTDSLLKTKIPLYYMDTLRNGIYKTYESFKMQQPEIRDFEAFFSKKKFWYLALPNKKGKYDEPVSDSYYAFVYKGMPYIFTSYGAYPAEKKDGDFFFKGKYNVSGGTGVLPAVAFGMVGVALFNHVQVQNGEAKILYRTGEFSLIRQEKKADEKVFDKDPTSAEN